MRWIPLDRLPDLIHFLERKIRTSSSWTQRRNGIAIALGLHGMRSCEVLDLDRDSFNPTTGAIYVRTRKRGNPRTVPVGDRTGDALVDLLACHPHVPLLPSRSGRRCHSSVLRTYCRRWTMEALGLPFHFHALRHTYAMTLYDRTKDILLVKRALGHRNLANTMVYAETLADMRQLLLFDLEPARPRQMSLFESSTSGFRSSSRSRTGTDAVDRS